MAATSGSRAFTYDVFLSFRGPDTRHGFTGYLHQALCASGIYAFLDAEDLRNGEEITRQLTEAIKESRFAIIVLSTNYASSSFCLEELAYILECLKGEEDRLVYPVFYKVEPSDVRHHRCYGDALARHENRFKENEESLELNMKKLGKWKKALDQVANMVGCHYKDGVKCEYECIEKIVGDIFTEINHREASIHIADSPFGPGSQVRDIRDLLDVESVDVVHMIGIHGMGGIGKSTLVGAVYNLIIDHFDGSCFLQNVREESNKHGLKHLQSILLSQILGKKEINLASEQQGTSMIQNRFRQKKILLILDDVDEHKQLQAIVGSPDWFGSGSRIIITTRNKQLLEFHEVKRIYEVKKMDDEEARQLLIWKAFKSEKADPSYTEVLKDVVTHASGLPLALEVIGSNLFRKSIKEWESAIKQYKRIPNNQILEILKVSFEALEEEEKSVFLDIACCLKGYQRTWVEDTLGHLYDNTMKYHIEVLAEKSLIKFIGDRVTLHDLIESMGKEIDRQKSHKKPGKRWRLWLSKDIIQVLKDNSGTDQIKIICLDSAISDKEKKVEWDGNAFKEMKNLKVLIIRNTNFSQGPNYLPESLGILQWQTQVS